MGKKISGIMRVLFVMILCFGMFVSMPAGVRVSAAAGENAQSSNTDLSGTNLTERCLQKYPKLAGLVEKGLIGFTFEYKRDTLKFGTWEGKALEWEVLEYSDDGKYALIWCTNIICNRKYNEEDKSVTWKKCSLRKWLNEDFLNSAFTKSQRKLIKKTKIQNENNPYTGTKGGKATKDKVFLLTASEFEKYLEDNKKNGYVDRSIGFNFNGDADSYWLRTPGQKGNPAPDFDNWDWEDWEDYEEEDFLAGYETYVYKDGEADWSGTGVAYESLGVRPVMRIKLSKNLIRKNALSVGNKPLTNVYITLGSQDTEDGKVPIEWKILEYDEENSRALLLSRYLVGSAPYYIENNYTITDKRVTWEESKLRKKLNDDFYGSAFSKEEQALIMKVTIENKDDPGSKTLGGNDTSDRIFLLSLEELEKYFGDLNDKTNAEGRICRFTDGELFNWWLRSPGYGDAGQKAATAMCVDDDGSIYGSFHISNSNGVRPAMWINLE